MNSPSLKLSLNRDSLFLTGTLIIVAFVLVNRFDIWLNYQTTTGKCLNYIGQPIPQYSGGQPCNYLEYHVNGNKYYLRNFSNSLEGQEVVRVYYDSDNPEDAYTIHFFNFWWIPLLTGFIVILLLVALVYSFLGKRFVMQINVYDFSPFREAIFVLNKIRRR